MMITPEKEGGYARHDATKKAADYSGFFQALEGEILYRMCGLKRKISDENLDQINMKPWFLKPS